MRTITRAFALILAIALFTPIPAAGFQIPGAISGTITDASNGEPLVGMVVSVAGSAGGGIAYTADDGSYIVDGLATGTYTVASGNWVEGISSVFARSWWPGESKSHEAREVTVVAGEVTTGIDIALEAGGVVSGTIRDAWSEEPLAADAITLERYNELGWDGARKYPVESDGSFRILGLQGKYRLDVSVRNYLFFESDEFVIEPAERLTIDPMLTPKHGTPYATISGVACLADVTDTACHGPESEPLGEVTIEARRPGGSLLGSTTTDRWGGFHLQDLDPGKIVVSVAEPPPGMEQTDAPVYDIRPNEEEWDIHLMLKPMDVHLAMESLLEPTEMAPGEEAKLRLEALFAEAPAATAPFDLTGVVVAVHLPDGLTYIAHAGDGPYDPSSGRWSIPSLPFLGRAQMTITVGASEEGTYQSHAEIIASDWPDAAAMFGDGKGNDHTTQILRVSVAPVVPEEPEEATISGVVWLDANTDGNRDPDEEGVGGVTVSAGHTDGTVATAVSADDGTYRLASLPAGTYRVELDGGTLPEDMEAPATIHTLTLGAGVGVAGVDFGALPVEAAFPWWEVGLAVLLIAGIGLAGAWILMRMRRPPPTEELQLRPETLVDTPSLTHHGEME